MSADGDEGIRRCGLKTLDRRGVVAPSDCWAVSTDDFDGVDGAGDSSDGMVSSFSARQRCNQFRADGK